jgi:hypothetical protein
VQQQPTQFGFYRKSRYAAQYQSGYKKTNQEPDLKNQTHITQRFNLSTFNSGPVLGLDLSWPKSVAAVNKKPVMRIKKCFIR